MKISPNEEIASWRRVIDGRLAVLASYSSPNHSQTELQRSCAYVLQSGGKRLRGLLTCAVWDDLRAPSVHADSCAALALAVAIEVLHAASLVHDDLPALDNDDERRGRPSCHKAFGESTAILTGDALFGAAIVEIGSEASISTDVQARACRLLAQAWWDLCLGQQLDLAHKTDTSSATHDTTQYATMVRLKTGALFGASVAAGALCAGVRDGALAEYVAWGSRVGECFQALDDLDDGDRPEKDRAAIIKECTAVRQAGHALDARLTKGTTQAVLDLIFGSQSE